MKSTLAKISFTRKVPVITLSSSTASFASILKTLALVFLASSGFLAYLGQLVLMCPFSLQL
ncbi:hypothetical protein HanPI659440_Chr00c08g0720371 [Helianthus annuus]|nr:hypothetical protein HanPI659440_Chr00c08g0720371 [Helianthus annuus]